MSIVKLIAVISLFTVINGPIEAEAAWGNPVSLFFGNAGMPSGLPDDPPFEATDDSPYGWIESQGRLFLHRGGSSRRVLSRQMQTTIEQRLVTYLNLKSWDQRPKFLQIHLEDGSTLTADVTKNPGAGLANILKVGAYQMRVKDIEIVYIDNPTATCEGSLL